MSEASTACSTIAPSVDRPALAALRRLVADRIERDLAFLDLLDGNTDLEPDACFELSRQAETRGGCNVLAA